MNETAVILDKLTKEKSKPISWILIALMLAFILFKGIFTLMVVGNPGQPDWDYGAVPDVPASSPYGEYRLLPFPQHVEGERGK